MNFLRKTLPSTMQGVQQLNSVYNSLGSKESQVDISRLKQRANRATEPMLKELGNLSAEGKKSSSEIAKFLLKQALKSQGLQRTF